MSLYAPAKPTRIWVDTEFNGYQGDLISMALVTEHGLRWYVVLECPNPVDWVAEHVMPVLGKHPTPLGEAQQGLEAFLGAHDGVHIIADWPDDLVHFCRFLITGPGQRLDTPPLTLEIRRDLDAVPSAAPHNALADAIALRLSHQALEAQSGRP